MLLREAGCLETGQGVIAVTRRKKIEDFFRKLEAEAGGFPVECLRLTDGDDWWQGLFVFDNAIPETRKNFLSSTFSRLSGLNVPSHNNSLARKDSCQVSPEERAQLFSFLKKGDGGESK
ncbi:MAG: hypothetical protein H8E41_00725 [Desulfobulbaceae bacterium]|uniref:Uncharacterized protein n=1 Tax=Candidatus Desulfobia pelagia TaxID=2841692 RepID=A0A8J6NC36_9BACT|nr:hypothetical protein [Candidatus Desulfobia pelagia]